MSTESDTPRTDAGICVVSTGILEDKKWGIKDSFVRADLSRQLERENAELRRDRERLRQRCLAFVGKWVGVIGISGCRELGVTHDGERWLIDAAMEDSK